MYVLDCLSNLIHSEFDFEGYLLTYPEIYVNIGQEFFYNKIKYIEDKLNWGQITLRTNLSKLSNLNIQPNIEKNGKYNQNFGMEQINTFW